MSKELKQRCDRLFLEQVKQLEESIKTGNKWALSRATEINTALMGVGYVPTLKIPMTVLRDAAKEVVDGKREPDPGFSWKESDYLRVKGEVEERAKKLQGK